MINAGDRIVIHSAAAEPRWLTEQLARWAPQLGGVDIDLLMPMKPVSFAGLAPEHVKIHLWFPGRGLRGMADAPGVEYLRYPLSQIPDLYTTGMRHVDVLFLHLSLPDEQGCLSLGVSVDYMPAVLATHPLVVAEVDPAMPRTRGKTCLKWEQVDYWVLREEGPLEVPSTPPDEGERRMAQTVADMIPDGAVLQTGVGAIPDAVLRALAANPPRDLGIHTGILTDAMLDLIMTGCVTNLNKPTLSGKTVATMAVGTKALYDYVNGNDAVEFHPCSVTHHPQVLGALDHLCAINSALQVDLSGRVNAEQVNGRIIAGPGGLPDFAQAARAVSGGLSVVTLRATTRDGQTSNIVPFFPRDVPATLAPGQIDFVVTEFGVADLRGLSPSRLAMALITVAHPDFRDDLVRYMV